MSEVGKSATTTLRTKKSVYLQKEYKSTDVVQRGKMAHNRALL